MDADTPDADMETGYEPASSGGSSSSDRRRGDMATRAYEALRTAIVDGTYTAETRLKEADLAVDLGMSRTPIREAIRQLELDGFVSVAPNRGAIVRGTTAQDVEEIFALRAVLEGFAASEAAQKMSDDQITSVAAVHSGLSYLIQRADCRDVNRLMELNSQFHRGIVRGSHNARLVAFHDMVTELPLQWRAQFWASHTLRAAAAMYHGEIVEALRARDPLRADAVMKSHMYAAKDYFANQSHQRTSSPVHQVIPITEDPMR